MPRVRDISIGKPAYHGGPVQRIRGGGLRRIAKLVRFSDRERAELEALAEAWGVDACRVIRTLVHDAFAALAESERAVEPLGVARAVAGADHAVRLARTGSDAR